MDRDTILDLLALVAAADHRTVGEPDFLLWKATIGHLDVADCIDAIQAFRRDQPGSWLEPGHVLARVRMKTRDRLDRADPALERPLMVGGPGARRDSFGILDKSASEDDWPRDWTPFQRLNAYWQKVDAHRDKQEYNMGASGSPRLLKARAASDEARAAVMAAFADRKFALADADEVGPQGNPLNALGVACPFCRARAGTKCTASGTNVKLTSMSAHPARVELAACEAGHPPDVVAGIVEATCRRQAVLVRSTWSDQDKVPAPITSPAVSK